MKAKHVVIVAVLSVLVAMGALWAFLAGKDPGRTQLAAGAVDARDALVRMHAATAGNPDARVHIVEFLDPACETCGEFYPLVKKIMAGDPDRIRLSVRLVAFHRGSDPVVRMLEASKRQGKFWPVLERILATQPAWVIQHVAKPDLAWAQLAPLGLDLDRLKADMESPGVVQNVAVDLQDAKALKVTKTPEFFVNGRPLPSFGLEQLQQLVAQSLAGAYR